MVQSGIGKFHCHHGNQRIRRIISREEEKETSGIRELSTGYPYDNFLDTARLDIVSQIIVTIVRWIQDTAYHDWIWIWSALAMCADDSGMGTKLPLCCHLDIFLATVQVVK